MREPVVEPDEFRLRLALIEARQVEEMKLSETESLPATRSPEITEGDLVQAQRGIEMILLEQKERNIRNRDVMEKSIWTVVQQIVQGLEDMDVSDIITSFSGQSATRAIKSLNELVGTLQKALNLVIKEEEFVGAGQDVISSLSMDQIDGILDQHDSRDVIEIQEAPTVIEYEEAEDEYGTDS